MKIVDKIKKMLTKPPSYESSDPAPIYDRRWRRNLPLELEWVNHIEAPHVAPSRNALDVCFLAFICAFILGFMIILGIATFCV